MLNFSEIPEPEYIRDEQRLISYYKKAFKNIANELPILKGGIEKAQSESLLRQIAFILSELDTDTRQWCDEVLRTAFINGQAYAALQLGDYATLADATAGVQFSLLAKENVEALINDTYGDLLLATQNTEKKIKQLVRQAVSETLRVRAIEQAGRRTLRKEIVTSLSKGGLSAKLDAEAWVGIVDKAGRRWNLSAYSEMVVRTKIRQAHIEGVRTETLERGVDLAVVSSHGAKDSCSNFEGLVISLNGETKGYLTYDQLKATGKIFHPCCKHHVSPLRELSLLPESLQQKNDVAQTKAAALVNKT